MKEKSTEFINIIFSRGPTTKREMGEERENGTDLITGFSCGWRCKSSQHPARNKCKLKIKTAPHENIFEWGGWVGGRSRAGQVPFGFAKLQVALFARKTRENGGGSRAGWGGGWGGKNLRRFITLD